MVTLNDSYDKLSEKNIEDFECTNKVKLTSNYREFLFKWNGGTPDVAVFKVPQWKGITVMHYFYGIDDPDNDLEVYLDIYKFRLPEGFIPIGNDGGGNAILLGTTGPYYDHIYFWDHENEPDLEGPDMSNMYFLANNIWEFLDSLYEDDE